MLKFVCLLFLIGGATCLAPNLTETSGGDEFLYSTAYRQGRRSAFVTGCTTDDGNTGTCKSRFACMREGGTMKGYCSGGYGICCEMNLEIGGVSNLKRTVIRNPTVLPQMAEYTIAPYSSTVCQLHIHFQRLELAQPQFVDPTVDPEPIACVNFLEVGRFSLCGYNNDQHLYLPFNGANDESRIPLRFHLDSPWQQSAWNLIVTQLECPVAKTKYSPIAGQSKVKDLRTIFKTQHGNNDLDMLAPPGCDQYHTGVTGTIKSFNYNPSMGSVYVPDMSYVICVKSPMTPSLIEYKLQHFALARALADNYDESCHTTVSSDIRSDDYLTIPQSTVPSNSVLQPIYYCGEFTNGLTVQAFPPFVMYFNSDKRKRANYQETGFSIDYNVKPVYRG